MIRLKTNNIRLLFGIVLICILISVPFLKKQNHTQKIINYVLNGRKYRLSVSNKEDEWEKGLMYYRKLDGIDGMIFIFPDKQYRSFWNKNTYMDLKLYWLDDNKVVGEDFLPSIEKSKDIIIKNSPRIVDKVIELVNDK